jgi:hypothetical protein
MCSRWWCAGVAPSRGGGRREVVEARDKNSGTVFWSANQFLDRATVQLGGNDACQRRHESQGSKGRFILDNYTFLGVDYSGDPCQNRGAQHRKAQMKV